MLVFTLIHINEAWRARAHTHTYTLNTLHRKRELLFINTVLQEIKDGQLAEWRCAPAPPCAKKYWKLSVQCYVKRTLKETDIR